MGKIIVKGFVLMALFVGIWIGVSQVNWVKLFRVQQGVSTISSEFGKLGDLYWKYFKGQHEEVCDTIVIQRLDSLLNHICTENGIDTASIKLHIVSDSDVNAFSLPDGHLVINTGLLEVAQSDDEIGGVLCHEIAHIEKDHVMKKLIKEIGLATLMSNATGGNADFMFESIRMLSSTAYDRKMERKADLEAVNYLHEAKMNPDGLVVFLKKLDSLNASGIRIPTWISTHPDNVERINAIKSAILQLDPTS
jgi:beta-barrel assembly-enhancing protease